MIAQSVVGAYVKVVSSNLIGNSAADIVNFNLEQLAMRRALSTSDGSIVHTKLTKLSAAMI